MSERYRVAPAVHIFIERPSPRDKSLTKILFLRRCGTGYRDGDWGLVAGHQEPDESLLAAAAREAEEETGLCVAPDDLEYMHTMHTRSEIPGDPSDERLDVYFRATHYTGEPLITEPDKCGGLEWFPENGLPESIVPRVKEAILHIRAGVQFSELGW